MLQIGTKVQINKNCELANLIGAEGIIIEINAIQDFCNYVRLNKDGRKAWFADRELDAEGYMPVEMFEAEQEMQALDAHLEQEEGEEFGTPNATYCQSEEPDHNGGWFCYHPDCVTSPEYEEF